MQNKFPGWLQKKPINVEQVHTIKSLLRKLKVRTVCELARCPNIGECFSKPTATFMILGDRCTRGCKFCNIQSQSPARPDFEEPVNIAEATRALGLKHVVVTSVTRDDLADGGAYHFAATLFQIKKYNKNITTEVLIPDFMGSTKAIRTVVEMGPDILNHNMETVPRLYQQIRHKANYERSLKVLRTAKRINNKLMTKSGLMLGLGEREDEVIAVMKDLKAAQCDILTIGQYLQPSKDNICVQEYVKPEDFLKYKEIALELGFLHVESAPFVRSSYNAEVVCRK
ncbi:MAG: lipoyl synthase [bacterium]|nr:lipoyl synthase [bacterium]